MYCKNCGNKLEDGSIFCGKCGYAISSAAFAAEEQASNEHNLRDTDTIEETIPIEVDCAAESAISSQDSEIASLTPSLTTQTTESNRSKSKKKHSHKQGIVSCIVSVLLCILLIGALFVSTLITVIRVSLSEDNCNEWINELELDEIEIPYEDGDYRSVTVLLQKWLRIYGNQDYLSKSAVKSILNNSRTKRFVKNIVEDYRAFLLEGKSGEGLSIDEFVSFVSDIENSDFMYYRYMFESEYGTSYEEGLTARLKNAGFDKCSIEELSNTYKDEISIIRLCISKKTMFIAWEICAIIVILLILLNHSYFTKLMIYFGVPLIIIGILYGTGGLIIDLILSINSSSIFYVASELITSTMASAGLVMITSGVLMLIVRIIIKLVCRKKQKATL